MIGIKLKISAKEYEQVSEAVELLTQGDVLNLRKGYNHKDWCDFVSITTDYLDDVKDTCSKTTIGIYLRPLEKIGEISLFSLSKESIRGSLKTLENVFKFPVDDLKTEPAFSVIANFG